GYYLSIHGELTRHTTETHCLSRGRDITALGVAADKPVKRAFGSQVVTGTVKRLSGHQHRGRGASVKRIIFGRTIEALRRRLVVARLEKRQCLVEGAFRTRNHRRNFCLRANGSRGGEHERANQHDPSQRTNTHSHSIVPGGFELISYTTRLIPRTSLTIRFETRARKGAGSCAQSAVIPSTLVTALNAQTNSYVRSSPITPTVCTGSRTAKACQTSW